MEIKETSKTLKVKCACGVETVLDEGEVKNSHFLSKLKQKKVQIYFDGQCHFHVYFGNCLSCGDFLLACLYG